VNENRDLTTAGHRMVQHFQGFAEDMTPFVASVRQLVTVPLTSYQFDALVSFRHSVGEDNFARSTLLRKVNEGDFGGVLEEFWKWARSGGKVHRGLARRRVIEELLFEGHPDRNYSALREPKPPKFPMPHEVDMPLEEVNK